ncbi:MAG: CvpA family protein [Clostridia bacterium]|nr:CvpA family protein [Clostridia bacterium]
MNWSDLIVLGIILAFAVVGMVKGFILSVFRLTSFFVSIIISIKFYPVAAEFLKGTFLYTSIQKSIFKSLMLQQQTQGPNVGEQVKQSLAQRIIESLHLPGFMKDMVTSSIPDIAKLTDVSRIVELISRELASIAVSVISLVLLYIAVRIALIFVRIILEGVAKLPVFKQLDKLCGFALGAVEGLLTVYIILAVVMLFNAAPQFGQLFEAMESSVLARFLYQHNFIVDWMFPGKPTI